MQTSIEDAQHELLAHVAIIYEERLCSDLEIDCNGKVFKVHKSMLSARSPVFRKMFAGWKEEHEGRLTLGHKDPLDEGDLDASEDPVAVKMMVDYIYKADYDPGSDPYDLSSMEEVDAQDVQKDIHSQINLLQLGQEAHHVRADDSRPNMILEEEVHDATNSTAHSTGPGGDQDRTPVHCGEEEAFNSMRSDMLRLHAKVYSLGDKYDMPTLQDRALEKFEEDARQLSWDDDAFCSAVEAAYALTPPKNDRLRSLIVEIFHEHNQGVEVSTAIKSQICELPELAYSLWLRGLQPSPGPDCGVCKTVKVVQCSGQTTADADGWNPYRSCSRYFATCLCLHGVKTCSSCSAGLPVENNKMTKKMKRRLRA